MFFLCLLVCRLRAATRDTSLPSSKSLQAFRHSISPGISVPLQTYFDEVVCHAHHSMVKDPMQRNPDESPTIRFM